MTPYAREMRLMPHIMAMERRGVNIDVGALKTDTDYYFNRLAQLDSEIGLILGKQVDVDSNDSLADAIEAKGLSKGFARTPTGRRSTAKESLLGAISNPTLLGHLLCRGAIATCVRTFFQPWLTQGLAHGKLYIKWNQFRNYTDTGARTGRLSSSPNLQNIPVTWEGLTAQLEAIGYKPDFPLPCMRKYIVPREGCILISRDYSAQEMRLLAHFVGGSLLKIIQDNPDEDIHQIAAQLAHISRREAKTLAFAILYGAGVGRVAESLNIPVSTASMIRAQYLNKIPEIKVFSKSLTEASHNGLPVKTIAGREYYVQAPAVVQGRMRTFEYKLANYKIQGSAADQTKEAMWRYATTTKNGNLLLGVHDQIVAEVLKEAKVEEEAILEQAMNSAFQDELQYKIVSDPAWGENFGMMIKGTSKDETEDEVGLTKNTLADQLRKYQEN